MARPIIASRKTQPPFSHDCHCSNLETRSTMFGIASKRPSMRLTDLEILRISSSRFMVLLVLMKGGQSGIPGCSELTTPALRATPLFQGGELQRHVGYWIR